MFLQRHQDFKQKLLYKWLPEQKVINLDSHSHALNALRRAGTQKQENVAYRDKRSYLLAEHVKFTPDIEVGQQIL